ncbi:hypothetical protein LPJ53_005206 [Coemansia erecta]|uniref:Uncharacterized protein n=1 Tax=Coemansia erecta TaxID=147472 RepID=A0A9W7XXD1_9FUNG|nr:hypothetical protein LPJ53_005206 [Coemansia erecta]
MTSITIFVVSNAICLVLFSQSLWVGLVQIIRRQAILPPVAPSNDLPDHQQPSASFNEAHHAISRAVHPHLHHAPSRPGTTSDKLRLTTSCSSTTTVGRCTDQSLYTSTIPYLSTLLLFLQAALGVTVTLVSIFASPSKVDCTHIAQYTLIIWHLGMTLMFTAAAVQTHLANDRCVKIFFIVFLGVAANSAFLGLILGRHSYSGTEHESICLIDVLQPDGWLGNLPTYIAVSHFFTCFFTGISYINASSRLCVRARFLSFKEITFVLAVYRGLGMLFASFLLGVLLSAAIIGISALRMLHYSPWWIVQWAVMSRVFAAGMWHRANTDEVAQGHPFWSSEEYLVWHPVMRVENGNTWKPRVSSAVARYAGSVMNIVCTTAAHGALAASSDGSSLDKNDNAANMNTLRRTSRHDTVVEDNNFHCPSCTCAIFQT